MKLAEVINRVQVVGPGESGSVSPNTITRHNGKAVVGGTNRVVKKSIEPRRNVVAFTHSITPFVYVHNTSS